MSDLVERLHYLATPDSLAAADEIIRLTASLATAERERDAAVAAERERCAKVADAFREGHLRARDECLRMDNTQGALTRARQAQTAQEIARDIRSLLSPMPAERVEIAGSGETDEVGR